MSERTTTEPLHVAAPATAGTKLGAYAGRVLRIDLTTRGVSDYPWSDDDRRRTIGGKSMAAEILLRELSVGTDPLGPDNIVVISTGPLTGTGAPSTARFNVSALSPLTGLPASSNCGGPFGTFLKRARYDALVITGQSPDPVWLEVAEDGVTFHPAGDLWGTRTGEAEVALAERVGAKQSGQIVIGPAGESRVRYASLHSGERAAGRAGLGAVFGAKRLKGIVAHGDHRVAAANPEQYREFIKKWTGELRAHPMTGDRLPKYGTAGFLEPMQRAGILATRNYTRGRFEGASKISGEALAETRLVKNGGCLACPIRCERVVEHEGKNRKGPELETLALFGSNLENADLDVIIEMNVLADELGMDTISAGSTIGFAMELTERGLFESDLKFGRADNLLQTLEDIAYRRGIGDDLADGTRALAQRYGAAEAAMNVKGLEIAAYDPRRAVGQGLGYAISNRGGCHLNGGYAVALEGLALKMGPTSTASKPALTALLQDLMEAVSSTGCCLFTTFGAFPSATVTGSSPTVDAVVAGLMSVSGPVLAGARMLPPGVLNIPMPLVPHIKALELATGVNYGFGRVFEAGERAYTAERLLALRFGATTVDDTLPGRLLDEPIDNFSTGGVPLAGMIAEYYRHRGWDLTGVPSPEMLHRLGLSRHL